MTIQLTNERLRALIPNIIHEVKGETPLLTKMQPWLDTAREWLEGYFLGTDFEPAGPIVPIVERIIVNKAFAMAVPSLDLSLSPSGFTVINTDGRAPASKERVERLIASLGSVADSNLEILVDMLLRMPEWTSTPMGQWWLGTFTPRIAEAFRFRGQSGLFDTYRILRSLALRFEREVAELYMGDKLLRSLRQHQLTDGDHGDIVAQIREAELQYISCHMRDQKVKCPDEHEVWHLIRPVVDRLRYYPELYRQWKDEMGERFRPEPFKNDIKGGYYF